MFTVDCFIHFFLNNINKKKYFNILSNYITLYSYFSKCFTLGEFENATNYMNIMNEKVVEKFFRYCMLVVDVLKEETFKKLHHCEEQVKHKTVL